MTVGAIGGAIALTIVAALIIADHCIGRRRSHENNNQDKDRRA